MAADSGDQQALDTLEQLQHSDHCPRKPAGGAARPVQAERSAQRSGAAPEAPQELAAEAAAVLSAMRTSRPQDAQEPPAVSVKAEPGVATPAGALQPAQAAHAAAVKAEGSSEARGGRQRQAPRPWWVTRDRPEDLIALQCAGVKLEPRSPSRAPQPSLKRGRDSAQGTPQAPVRPARPPADP